MWIEKPQFSDLWSCLLWIYQQLTSYSVTFYFSSMYLHTSTALSEGIQYIYMMPHPVSLCTLLPIFPASIYQESIFRLAILWSFHIGERTHCACPFLSCLSQLRSPRATGFIAQCVHTVSTFSLSFICPWTLGWLHNLATVTSIAADMGEEASLPYADYVPFGYASRRGLTGPCGRSSFSVLRSLSTGLQ